MHSGSSSTTNPLPHDPGASSPRSSGHQPVRSPFDHHNHSSTRHSVSPSASSPTRGPPRPREAAKGDHPDTLNGHDDSEAETLRLSDEDDHKSSPPKRSNLRDERTEKANRSSPSLVTRSEPARSHPGSRASSVAVETADRVDRKENGGRPKENGVKNEISRLSGHGRPRPLHEIDAKSSRAHSADASRSPVLDGVNRVRQPLSAEPRKRKFSDGNLPSKSERPRQKARLDGHMNDSGSSPVTGKSKSASLPTSSTSGARHSRSTSNQSHLTNTSSAPPRRRRDTHSVASEDKRNFDDSSSEAASPRPPPLPLLAPPQSKLSARALISPARATAMAHGKKTDKFGLTALARACERGKLSAVKSAYEQSPDELDYVDNAGYAPLQKAALEGHADIVKFLLQKGCRKDCQSKNQDTPLIDAVENCHVEVVRLLLDYGVNPHHQNDRGQRAIDLVDHDEDGAEEIELMLQKAMRTYEGPESEDDKPTETPASTGAKGERKDLLHKENTAKSLLEYAQRGDIEAVDYFLNMRVKPNVECCVAAARGGHETILNLLLVDVSDKDPDPVAYEETPLLAAIGRGHTGVIRLLLDQEGFNPCRRTREGKTYWEIAEERHGPKWQSERDLLKERYDQYRSTHPLKGGKKKRLDAPVGLNHGRVSSTNKADLKSPKITSPKHTNKPKPKAESADKTDDTPRRRLMSAREMSLKDRRRRVVYDESSDAHSDKDEDAEVRTPNKGAARRRMSSTAEQQPRKVKNQEHQLSPSSKSMNRSDKPDRVEKIEKREKRKADSSTSPHEDRRKRIDTKADKGLDKVHSSDGPLKGNLQERVKEETPDSIREDRLEMEKAEAERIRREKDEAEAKRIAEEERREEEKRRQEEKQRNEEKQRQEELKRREEEEERRKEEERVREEQKRLQEEQRRLEEERARKEEEARRRRDFLNGLPTALRFALQHGANRPVTFSTQWSEDPNRPVFGIDANFLPILHWPLSHIDPDCPASRGEEKWMMSFQAVGVLGLPELNLKEYPQWEKRDVPYDQRETFLGGYCIDKLAHFYYIDIDEAAEESDDSIQMGDMPQNITVNGDHHSAFTSGSRTDVGTAAASRIVSNPSRHINAALDGYYDAIEDAKVKFMAMAPLFYIRYDDFIAAASEYPHLKGFNITSCRGPPVRPIEPPQWLQELSKNSTSGSASKSASAAPTPRAGTPKADTSKEPLSTQEQNTAQLVEALDKADHNVPAAAEQQKATPSNAALTDTVADAAVKQEHMDSPGAGDEVTNLSNPIKAMVEAMKDDHEMIDSGAR